MEEMKRGWVGGREEGKNKIRISEGKDKKKEGGDETDERVEKEKKENGGEIGMKDGECKDKRKEDDR